LASFKTAADGSHLASSSQLTKDMLPILPDSESSEPDSDSSSDPDMAAHFQGREHDFKFVGDASEPLVLPSKSLLTTASLQKVAIGQKEAAIHNSKHAL
jgi:hypothetical protein